MERERADLSHASQNFHAQPSMRLARKRKARNMFFFHNNHHNDLDILENLKELIKSGQHEFYRAEPQPAALASVYLGVSFPSQRPFFL
jgi:hypothetical protein